MTPIIGGCWTVPPSIGPYSNDGALSARSSHFRLLRKPCSGFSSTPVSGSDLHLAWWAVSCRHDAYYWMEDVDPFYLLKHGYGIDVTPDGVVNIPDEIVLCDDMSEELKRELELYFRGGILTDSNSQEATAILLSEL